MSNNELARKFKDCTAEALAPAAADAALDGLLALARANEVDAAVRALAPS